jgi:hypothetical protein
MDFGRNDWLRKGGAGANQKAEAEVGFHSGTPLNLSPQGAVNPKSAEMRRGLMTHSKQLIGCLSQGAADEKYNALL